MEAVLAIICVGVAVMFMVAVARAAKEQTRADAATANEAAMKSILESERGARADEVSRLQADVSILRAALKEAEDDQATPVTAETRRRRLRELAAGRVLPVSETAPTPGGSGKDPAL